MKQLKTIKFPGIDETYYVPEYDLTQYATNQSVQEQIAAIELLPGPQGEPGKDGEDYVLTDADKAEIAGMVEVTGGGGDCPVKAGTGTNSVMSLNAASANGNNAIALSYNATANGYNGIALGGYTRATASDSVAIGENAASTHLKAIAIGYKATTGKNYQLVLGQNSSATDTESNIVIGNRGQNAMTVDADNVAHFPGNVKVGADDAEVATKAYVEELIGGIENGSY